jgi:hypothetical protein
MKVILWLGGKCSAKTVRVKELTRFIRRGSDQPRHDKQLTGGDPAVGGATAQRLVVAQAAAATGAHEIRLSGIAVLLLGDR